MSEPGFAELISRIAHELRSPLTAVQGFSGTLVKRWERFDDDQRKQLVETIHTDAVRMGRIVSEVLDLARMETGRLELERTDVDVAAAAERVVERVARLPGADRIVVEVEDGVAVLADVGRLDHILGNLVENALKFSDEGSVSVRAQRASDGWVELSVEDEGIGIALEQQPELFAGPDPSSARSAPTGSGLGLYLTKRFVDAHGGSITVDSEPGRGSRFVVRLPSGRAP